MKQSIFRDAGLNPVTTALPANVTRPNLFPAATGIGFDPSVRSLQKQQINLPNPQRDWGMWRGWTFGS